MLQRFAYTPIVGITLDCENSESHALEPHYALRMNYADAVVAAGGLPLALPYAPKSIPALLNILDAVVVTGGMFDINPDLYGAESTQASLNLKPQRTEFEAALIRGALDQRIPILGICGGMQLLGVIAGATLIQHIPTAVSDALEHLQSMPCSTASHAINVEAGTLLGDLLKTDRISVNSLHHQSIGEPGRRVRVSATAPDGVVEAIEVIDQAFAIGVQWHPEYGVAGETGIFTGLVRAAADFRQARTASRSLEKVGRRA